MHARYPVSRYKHIADLFSHLCYTSEILETKNAFEIILVYLLNDSVLIISLDLYVKYAMKYLISVLQETKFS